MLDDQLEQGLDGRQRALPWRQAGQGVAALVATEVAPALEVAFEGRGVVEAPWRCRGLQPEGLLDLGLGEAAGLGQHLDDLQAQ